METWLSSRPGARPERASRRWSRSRGIAGRRSSRFHRLAGGIRPEGIEDSFETTKNELGLDHNETRSWHGWHRHVSLVMLAFAMMAAIRHHANDKAPPKTNRRHTRATTAKPHSPLS